MVELADTDTPPRLLALELADQALSRGDCDLCLFEVVAQPGTLLGALLEPRFERGNLVADRVEILLQQPELVLRLLERVAQDLALQLEWFDLLYDRGVLQVRLDPACQRCARNRGPLRRSRLKRPGALF